MASVEKGLPVQPNFRYPASRLATPVKESMKIAGLKDHMQNVVRGMLKNKRKKLNITPQRNQPLGGNPLKLSLNNSIRGRIDAAGMGKFNDNTRSNGKVRGGEMWGSST